MTQNERFTNRELSWLAFNKRVLSEAKDNHLPLMERLKFLSITASNLEPAIDQFDQTGKFFLYLVHLHNKIGLSEPKVRKISDAGNGLSADCQKFTDAARRLFSESEKLCISLLRMQNRTKNLRTDTAPALLHIPTLKKSS